MQDARFTVERDADCIAEFVDSGHSKGYHALSFKRRVIVVSDEIIDYAVKRGWSEYRTTNLLYRVLQGIEDRAIKEREWDQFLDRTSFHT